MLLMVWAFLALPLAMGLADDYQDWTEPWRTNRRRRDTEADLNGVDFSRAARQALRIRRRQSRAAEAEASPQERNQVAIEPSSEAEGEPAPYWLLNRRRRRRRRREDTDFSHNPDESRFNSDYPQDAMRQPLPLFRKRRGWLNSEMSSGLGSRGAEMIGNEEEMQKKSEGMLGNAEEREEEMEEKIGEKRTSEIGAGQPQGAARNVRGFEGESQKRLGSYQEAQWRTQDRGFPGLESSGRSSFGGNSRQRRWWGRNVDLGASVRSPRGWFSPSRKSQAPVPAQESKSEVEERENEFPSESRLVRSGYQDQYGAARYQSVGADEAFLSPRGSRAASKSRGSSSAYQKAVRQQQQLEHTDLEQRAAARAEQMSDSELRQKAGEESKGSMDSEIQQLPLYESEQRAEGWEEEYPELGGRESGPLSWEEQQQLAKEACIQKRMAAGEGGYGVVCEPTGYSDEYSEEAEEPIQKRGYILPDLEAEEYGLPVEKMAVEESKPLLEERGKREYYYQPESRRALRRVHRKLPEPESYPERRRRFVKRRRASDAGVNKEYPRNGHLSKLRFHRRRQVQSQEAQQQQQQRTARLVSQMHRMRQEKQHRHMQQQKQQQSQQQELPAGQQRVQEQLHGPEGLREPVVLHGPAAREKNRDLLGDLQLEGEPGAAEPLEAEAREFPEERLGRREYGDEKRYSFSSRGNRSTYVDSTTRFWIALLAFTTTISTLLISSWPALCPSS